MDRKVYGAQNEEVYGVRDEYLALISVYKAMGGGWMVEHDKQVADESHASVQAPSATASAQIPTTTNDVTPK